MLLSKYTMTQQKKWHVLNILQITNDKLRVDKIIALLLENRHITTPEERECFLHPRLEKVTMNTVGIDEKQVDKALQRIAQAIEKQEQIVVFGDYDVDGITGTAILWETLYALKAKVMPYIPDRVEEGYGLSLAGIATIQSQLSNIKLIITVDNGIVANEAVAFANKQGIDVIITDHHARGEKDPEAFAIVHTTKLCGAGVGWLLAKEIFNENINKKIQKHNDHLELVALATVADLVPLTGANRILVKAGLTALSNTKRAGLLALFHEAGIIKERIGVYEIGHIIAPRLNAMGRMASAMDSLRLLCTKDADRAKVLAEKLGRTNRERQLLTQEMSSHAIDKIKNYELRIKNLLFIYDETYEQGIIGLVASKLVETYYRPAIVLSKGEKHSKASARSISGFNIIEFIRNASHLLINAGGHPMAAGFTVETEKLTQLQETLELLAEEQVTETMLVRSVKIDCELPVTMMTQEVYDAMQCLAPFGMANAEPVFASRNVIIHSLRTIGQEGKHLKLELGIKNSQLRINAIGFGFGEYREKIKPGDTIDIAYVIDENEWNGKKSLQLKIKDIQIPEFRISLSTSSSPIDLRVEDLSSRPKGRDDNM